MVLFHIGRLLLLAFHTKNAVDTQYICRVMLCKTHGLINLKIHLFWLMFVKGVVVIFEVDLWQGLNIYGKNTDQKI